MRKVIFLFALMLSLSLSAQTKVKMMTFNLRFGELATLDELAEVIKKENPDYVALQEVDVKTLRSRAKHQNGKDFLSELAFKTGMFGIYGKTIPYEGGYYGIGILSKYPFVETKKVKLPSIDPAKEPRVVLYGLTEGANGDSLIVACTHLDYSSSASRLAQVATVKSVLEALPYPVILGGDFNAFPDSPEVKESFMNWSSLTNDEPTFSTKNPKSKIDYIFGFPEKAWKLISTEVLNAKVSDHFPVMSVVEMMNTK